MWEALPEAERHRDRDNKCKQPVADPVSEFSQRDLGTTNGDDFVKSLLQEARKVSFGATIPNGDSDDEIQCLGPQQPKNPSLARSEDFFKSASPLESDAPLYHLFPIDDFDEPRGH